ncbi:MAG: DUF4845 domain-containing protein [Cycloclasticus sp.]|nr:DUF4845 domain-containing protein [Cycloclasticus sp.]
MQASKQQGLTTISLLIVLGVFGLLVMSVLKVFPVYMEHLSVQTSVKSIKADPAVKNMSVGQIRLLFQKKLNMNQVTSISAKGTKIVRSSDEITFTAEYEVRKQYIGNVDIVLSFSDEFTIPL